MLSRIDAITIKIDNDGDYTLIEYYPTSGQWIINGVIYSRHMKVLTGITELCREADKK